MMQKDHESMNADEGAISEDNHPAGLSLCLAMHNNILYSPYKNSRSSSVHLIFIVRRKIIVAVFETTFDRYYFSFLIPFNFSTPQSRLELQRNVQLLFCADISLSFSHKPFDDIGETSYAGLRNSQNQGTRRQPLLATNEKQTSSHRGWAIHHNRKPQRLIHHVTT